MGLKMEAVNKFHLSIHYVSNVFCSSTLCSVSGSPFQLAARMKGETVMNGTFVEPDLDLAIEI